MAHFLFSRVLGYPSMGKNVAWLAIGFEGKVSGQEWCQKAIVLYGTSFTVAGTCPSGCLTGN